MTSILHEASSSQTISVQEAAELLGVSKWTLYRLANSTGEIAPGVRILTVGSRKRVPRERFMAFLAGEWPPANNAEAVGE